MLDRKKAALALRMRSSGEPGGTTANVLGVSRATVDRVLAGFVALAEAHRTNQNSSPSDPVG